MTDLHLTLAGEWEICQRPGRSCRDALHIPNMELEEAKGLPIRFLEPLIEAYDPPSYAVAGMKQWRDSKGRLHRDYGLPAVIRDTGVRAWFIHGIFQKQVAE